MIKHVFLDFNGTIIDDVDLCLNLLNEILSNQKKELVDLVKYKNIFRFPIIEYYRLAGIDFSLNSYQELAKWFIAKYQPLSLSCGLYEGVKETIVTLKSKGIKVYVLSASERNNLKEQCDHYGLTEWLDDILGINDIHAASKLELAKCYIKAAGINPNEAIFVGDTLHDYEVAKEVGMGCYLVSCGHQSIEVLKTAGVPIIGSVSDLRSELN